MKIQLNLPQTLAHLRAIIAGMPAPKTGSETTFRARVQRLHDTLQAANTATPTLALLRDSLFSGESVSASSIPTYISNFKKDLKQAVASLRHNFDLIQPLGRGLSADQITLHFEGVPLHSDLASPSNSSGILPTINPTEARMAPDVIRIFVSFAVKNKDLVEELVALLKKHWSEKRTQQLDFWMFSDVKNGGIIGGEKNTETIEKEIASRPIGLFMLSEAFSKSDFIKKYELRPYLKTQNGKKFPVFLNLDHTRSGADHLSTDIKKCFVISKDRMGFSECTANYQKNFFAEHICEHLDALIQKYFSPSYDGADHDQRSSIEKPHPSERKLPLLNEDKQEDGIVEFLNHYRSDGTESGVVAVDDLIAWACDHEQRSSYFALLGETGSGKTTTAMMFEKALNKSNKKEKAYCFDLRYASLDGLLEKNRRPILEEIMTSVLHQRGLKNTASDYLHALREENAVLIFDGLDEIFVYLNDSERVAFMHQLLQALPLADCKNKTAGKLLLTCRTHYFRDAVTERGGFTLQGREGLHVEGGRPDTFEIARMLPFSEEQIKAYFAANVPDLPFEKLWEILGEIHNLQELATQPYLLNLIRQQLPRINSMRERNETVRPVDLYENFISDWTQSRNEFHNVITADDKLELMELLAAFLWKNESRTMKAAELDKWLRDALMQNSTWAKYYEDLLKPRETSLFSDLRTASFVSRWEGDTFRFAHTSLQEYFLACYLVKSLLTDATQDSWNMPKPSIESFDFLGQLLEKSSLRDQKKSIENLTKLLGTASAPDDARRNALYYHLQAFQKNQPTAESPDLAMQHLDLEQIEFLATEQRPLRFQNVNLSHSILLQSKWENVKIAGEMNWDGADLRGSSFVNSPLKVKNKEEAKFQYCWERDSGLEGIEGITSLSVPETNKGKKMRLSLQTNGHSAEVISVAYSPDGKWFASSSSDDTVKVWDSSNGRCIASLVGHTEAVLSVVFSKNSDIVISASEDCTIKIWDVKRAQCLKTLEGHNGAIMSVAISADSNLIVSSSHDNTLKIWDICNECCIITIDGQPAALISVAFSPDATRIVSASADKLIKIWDVQSGHLVATLLGHTLEVTSAVFSDDAKHIISSSLDNTIKIWDACNGYCLFTLNGHSDDVWSAALSADGKLIVSSSKDKTVKLWDIKSQACLATYHGHSQGVVSATFSKDGNRIISASWDYTIKVWDIACARCIGSLVGPTTDYFIKNYYSDGSRIMDLDYFGANFCATLEGKRIPSPDESERWLKTKLEVCSYFGGKIFVLCPATLRPLRSILRLENCQTIVLEPWDETEAQKEWDDPTIIWKITRGPKDFWRYLHAVDPETQQIYPADYCLAENFTPWD